MQGDIGLPELDASGEAFVAALSDVGSAARLLDAVAQRTGDSRFRCAAGMLRGGRHGRPARVDDAALGQMTALLRDGGATSTEQAARFIARTLAGERSTAAAAERLARKYRLL
jgi:hypothetical protein